MGTFIMKLKSKLVLFSVLICMVSVLSISIINYFLSVRQLEAEINTNGQLETVNIAKDVDKWMALQKDSLEEVLHGFIYNNNYDHDVVKNYFVSKNQINPGNGYYVAFSDKYFIDSADWIPGSDYDPTSRDWYIGAKGTNTVYVSEPYVDADTGGIIITTSKSFETEDGRVGVIASDITIDFIVDFISNIELGEGSYAFLLDNNGNIITHKNSQFNPTETELTNIENVFKGKLKTIMEEDLSIRDIILTDYDEEDRSFFFSDVVESDWKVGVGVPVANTMETINLVY